MQLRERPDGTAKAAPVGTVRMVARGLARRCPRCGGGGVFHRWMTMRERCPTCGVRFDRKPEEAFFLGAFVIQVGLILLPLAVLLFLFGMATGGVAGGRPEVYVAIMVAHVVLTPFLTYPSTKTTWFAFDLAMGGLEPHEEREAEAAVRPARALPGRGDGMTAGTGDGHDHGPTDGRGHDEEPGHDHDHGHHGGHGHGHEHPKGLVAAVRSVFSPHSHDPSESVDQALTSSAEGLRTLKISLAGLAVTALLQVVVVLMSGSVALLGDTVHNFADALTAIPLGIAFVIGRRPPNRRYTYGYGRAEDLAGIFIVLVIAASAAFAGYEAVTRLMDPRDVEHVGLVIAAGVIGFVGNELVAIYRIRVGRRIGSAALVADGLHARTDGITSLAVVVGAVLVAAGWQSADPIVGLVITVAILGILRSAARDIYRRLMDSVEPELVDQVEQVLGEVDGIQGVDSVRLRWIGHDLRGEAEVVVDRDLSFPAAHEVAEEARHRLLHLLPRLADAVIHTSPCAHDGGDSHAGTAHHFSARRAR